MKFEMEKVDAPYLLRLVREEEERTGKRVIRIRLNLVEWHEFTQSMNVQAKPTPGVPLSCFAYRLPLMSRARASLNAAYDDTFRTVEVVPDCT